ncbi:ABC transporter permease [Desulfovibrio sp. TomC]|uniref:ABC transporter permease n=1 Tax=Desulfovibrio sp. TomC TaxID=1562888 RepID=UPI000573ABFD|nr:ABC transporter permease [Desulfovibrio sp. TomC]KHK04543.1 O-antigen export system permease protein RfbD [Desulfovibrio sp. TomC]
MYVPPKAMVVRRPRAGSLWSGLLAGLNPMAFVRAFWQRREVLATFARIEFSSRYHGAQLGVLWSLVSPLATLAVYTFVFSVVFKPTWAGGGDGGVAGYALILFAGLAAFEVFAGSLNRAPRLLSENVNFIKKVLFPLEILPVGVILAAVLESLVSLALVALGVLVTTGRLPATALFAPLAYLPLGMLTLGMCWLLAPVGVFLKDLGNIVGVAVQLLFFATPILYPLTAVPEPYRALLALNPLHPVVDHLRRTIIYGQMPDWPAFGWVTLVSAGVMLAGYTFFINIKRLFADAV